MSTDASEFAGTDVSEIEMDTVWDILKRHVGKDNAITSAELSEHLGGIDDLDSNPQTRKIIRGLIFKRNKPIGSGSQGYWVMASKGELEETFAQLNQRKHAITARQDALLEGWNSHDLEAGQ